MRNPSVYASRPRVPGVGGLILVGVLALAGCTPSGVLSPIPDVDVGVRTSALPAYAPPVQQSVPSFPAEPAFSSMPDQMSPEPAEPFMATAQPLPEVLPTPAQPEPAPVEIASAAPAQARGFQTLVPSNPYMNSVPRMTPELSQPAAMPQGEVECRRQLRRLGVEFTDLQPINDGGACEIDYPVKVSKLPAGISMRPAATLTCQMALAFSTWTKAELNPAARRRYFSGVKTIHQGSSYSCRRIAGTRTASEHSKGNALDVMRIELNSGRDIDVRKPGFFRFREKSLLNTVRAGGCDYFTTVLGPGYNRDHADHFHFDIKNRRNGYVACR